MKGQPYGGNIGFKYMRMSLNEFFALQRYLKAVKNQAESAKKRQFSFKSEGKFEVGRRGEKMLFPASGG